MRYKCVLQKCKKGFDLHFVMLKLFAYNVI